MTREVAKSIIKALPENDTIILYQTCFGFHGYKPSQMLDILAVQFYEWSSVEFNLITSLLSMCDYLEREQHLEKYIQAVMDTWNKAESKYNNVFYLDYITL